MIHRRNFIIGATAGLCCMRPGLAAAQRPIRVGLLLASEAQDAESESQVTALVEGLKRYGWQRGRNLEILDRYFAGDPKRLDTEIAGLVAAAPDIIVSRSDPALRTLLARTRSIPIVFVVVADPVGNRLVASLARPGGNATGFSNVEPTLAGKYPELLQELLPELRRVAIISHPETLATRSFTPPVEEAAAALGLDCSTISIRSPDDIRAGLAAIAQQPHSAAVLLPSIVLTANRDLIIETLAARRVPAIYPFGIYAAAGGLLAYGMDVPHLFGEAATYVAKILNGARPGDLPVQQPDRFRLSINLRTAARLGLRFPPQMQQRADEVFA